MKRYVWITALFVALALVAVGCDNTTSPPTTITPVDPSAYTKVDLGDFTVLSAERQHLGWASNGYDDLDTDLNLVDLLEAAYLVLDLGTIPQNTLRVIWQGVGGDIKPSDWNQNDITSSSGVPSAAAGAALDGNTLTIELSKALKDYTKYVTAIGGAKILLGFYNNNLDDLGITNAHLLVPTREQPLTTVTVTFDVDGDTETIPPITVYQGYGMGAQYPDDPEKDGYVFSGWYNGTDRYESSTAVNADITLTAQWAQLITVTFVTGTGFPALAPIEVPSGGTLATTAAYTEPEQDGYDFDGWVDATNAAFSDTTPITASITLTAVWTKLHTVTFKLDADDTDVYKTVDVRNNESITFPDDPTKVPVGETGFFFEGWYKDGDFDSERYDEADPAITITAPITLVAQWRESTVYTVLFKLDTTDANAYATIAVEKLDTGATLLATNFPADPVNGLDAFQGWQLSGVNFPKANTAITASITVVAKWIKVVNLPTDGFTDAWGGGGVQVSDNVAVWSGENYYRGDYSFSTAGLTMSDYEALVIHTTLSDINKPDDKGSDVRLSFVLYEISSDSNDLAEFYPIDDAAIPFPDGGDFYMTVTGDAFTKIVADSGFRIQANTYSDAFSTGCTMTFVAIQLIPKQTQYGLKGSEYILNPSLFARGGWGSVTAGYNILVCGKGYMVYTLPGDVIISNFDTLVFDYTVIKYDPAGGSMRIMFKDSLDGNWENWDENNLSTTANTVREIPLSYSNGFTFDITDKFAIQPDDNSFQVGYTVQINSLKLIKK